ncbi:SMAD/FHA domain-containing protein [Phaeosphaeria sp. MPI-PUGE-AT-0046c]|nr:SMAD/FHA domain-containing protein [Phaeosphaeria sp. MPI-PUGE-AT-0046c]
MARDLSPFSARRLLTQQLAQEKTGLPQRSKTRSRSREHVRHQSVAKDTRPSDPPRGGPSKDAPIAVATGSPSRRKSPEPFRKPRDAPREKKRDRSNDRKRDRSRDRRRDRDGRRDKSPARRPSRSRDRRRERSRDREPARESKRDRSRDRHGRKDRSRSRDRKRRDKSPQIRRSRSPHARRARRQRTRSPSASASPPPKRKRRTQSASPSPPPHRRTAKPLPSQEISFRGLDDSKQAPSKYGGAPPDKEKPNFKATGALAKAANRVEGTKISLKYNEPPEARKPSPSQPWRLFVFKGDDVVDTIELWQKSCWLLGRAYEVVDYVLEHPSSSGQHAVIQFRYIQKTVEDEFGVKSTRGKVKPYIIDLESSNGTELNGDNIEASRYFELRDKDILKFAGSEREYVVMLPPAEK